MRKRLKPLCCGTVLLLGLSFTASAQYPVIPDSVQAASDARLAVEKRKSQDAWKLALETVKRDAANGKPYIPWAAKPSDLPQATIPAFPGAEGGGAFSFGGRGGTVYVVKTLADSGPGSFREACEQGGARVVVFNVSGIIRLKSPVIINAPYITISGRTAPGDGVCIAGESVWINTHDVVVSYMRFRRGETDVTRRDDGLGGNPVGNIMIDHVSASWGLDENMSIYRHVYDTGHGMKPLKLATVNVTIQNSIFSEGLDTYNHAFGSTIGGYNSTFMRNLWASNVGRNPSVGMDGSFNFVNNVVFNWWNRSVDGGGSTSEFNFVNNYYKPGPITPAGKPIAYRILKPESSKDADGVRRFGKVYAAGNITEGNDAVTHNNWEGGIQVEAGDSSDYYTKNTKVDKPFKMAVVTTTSATDAYDYVLKNAGATQPKRDAVDERVVRQVATGKIEYTEAKDAVVKTSYIKRRLPEDSYKQGIITDPKQVGGYPEYNGKPYKDKDNDGMPDDWEKKHGLNPNDPSDASKDISGDGYTNIEKYIYNIDPAAKADTKATQSAANTNSLKISTAVAALSLANNPVEKKVWVAMADQYNAIDKIEKERQVGITKGEALAATNKAAGDSVVTAAWSVARKKLDELHSSFLTQMTGVVGADKLVIVKDIMTDNGLQQEYDRFLALLPTLKEDEKQQVQTYLTEAREFAMDALNSRERHQWFAKYRGRANNYLSKKGYDLGLATAELKKKQTGK